MINSFDHSPRPRKSNTEHDKSLNWLIFIFLFLPIVSPDLNPPYLPWLQPQPTEFSSCAALIDRYLHRESIADQLANPIITNLEELRVAVANYSQVNDCINSIKPDNGNEEISRLQTLIRLFLIFTGQESTISQPAAIERIAFNTSMDPAIIKLRDEIGLPPPDGWVFLRTYSSRDEMPDVIAQAFRNHQIVGVTILSRYIAILKLPNAGWLENALQSQSLPKTVSHELVHAYVNSYLTEKYPLAENTFPRWFTEGLASYISRSYEPHSIMSANFSITGHETEDYQSYSLIFKYLQARLGKGKLYQNIRLALETADASKLYQGLGILDERWLMETANSWQRTHTQYRLLIGLSIFGVLIAGLYLFLPDLECACGFTGRRHDFPGRHCPACGKSVAGAQRKTTQKIALSLYPECQICSRHFWPWQHEKLHIYQRWIQIWISNPTGEERPLARHVCRICHTCLANSTEVEAMYRKTINERVAIDRQIYLPIIREWLLNAPRAEFMTSNMLILSFDNAVDEFLTAVLEPDYGEWMEPKTRLYFETGQPTGNNRDHDLLYPEKYDRIIRDSKLGQIGSVWKFNDQTIGISWEL